MIIEMGNKLKIYERILQTVSHIYICMRVCMCMIVKAFYSRNISAIMPYTHS